MKSVLFTTAIAVLVGSYTASAQPTITLADLTPAYGSEIVTHTTDFLDINTEGGNLNWDFSGLSSEGSQAITIESPTGQPGAELFPEATHAAILAVGEDEILTYQKYGDGEISMLGIYSEVGQGFAMIYTDPNTTFEFPMTFNDSFMDSYHSEVDFGSGITMFQDGESSSTVTGYGTINTPTGIYESVLQVKTLDASISTTSYNGTVISEDSTTTESYSYIKAGIPYPLISMSTSFVEGIPDSQSGSYSDVTSGLASNLGESINLGIFPNPAGHDVNLDFRLDKAGEVEMDLLSLDGQKVAQLMDRKTLSPGKISIRKNLPDLAAGTYMIRIQTPDGSATRKLVLTDR